MRRLWGIGVLAILLAASGVFWKTRSRAADQPPDRAAVAADLVMRVAPADPAPNGEGPRAPAAAGEGGAKRETPPPASPAPEVPGGRSVDQAKVLEEAGRTREALLLLTRAWRGASSDAERETVDRAMVPMVGRRLLSPDATDDLAFTHVLAAGENLHALCQRWAREKKVRATPGLILRMNGLPEARRLRAGTRLKVPRDDPGIEVFKGRFRLAVFLGDLFVKEYPVGVGPGDRTPVAEFRIETRLKNPPWTTPAGTIPSGDPRNILGTRWLGFNAAMGRTGLGVHGTTEPESIGTARSAGCIRMHNRDVEELFEWVPEGTVVRIVP